MGYSYKIAHGCKWLLLFYHNLPGGGFFNNTGDDPLDIDTPHKYSILYKLNSSTTEFGLIKGKYEFLMEFPNSQYPPVQWTQTSNPVTTTETSNTTESLGTIIKKIDDGELPFRGLARSINSNTFIDGDGHGLDNHWYSIGLFNYHRFTIPGPNHWVNETSLWIRVKHAITKKQIFHFHFGQTPRHDG